MSGLTDQLLGIVPLLRLGFRFICNSIDDIHLIFPNGKRVACYVDTNGLIYMDYLPAREGEHNLAPYFSKNAKSPKFADDAAVLSIPPDSVRYRRSSAMRLRCLRLRCLVRCHQTTLRRTPMQRTISRANATQHWRRRTPSFMRLSLHKYRERRNESLPRT